RAIVVDNLRGIRQLAGQRGWVLQLCHFHLLLKLQVRSRGRRYALRGGRVREEIDRLVRATLEVPDGPPLHRTLEQLHRIAATDCGTVRIQMMVREFLRRVPFYRSHLLHPALRLPRTTNAVESMGRLIREMLRSSRAGSNAKSVHQWATALIRVRSRVT